MKRQEDMLEYGYLGWPTPLQNYLIVGDFDKAHLYIRQRISSDRLFDWECLLYEYALWYMEKVHKEYTLSYDEAFKKISSVVSGFTIDEFEYLINANLIDFRYINRKQFFFDRCLESLLESIPEMRIRAQDYARQELLIDENDFVRKLKSIQDIVSSGYSNYYFQLQTSVELKEAVNESLSSVDIYLPIPIHRYNQKNITINSSSHSPDKISSPTCSQRTVYWNFKEEIPSGVWINYSYNHINRYIDIEKVKFTNQPIEYSGAQKNSHTHLSPYIKAMVDSVVDDTDSLNDKIIKIYNFITHNFRYSFAPSYSLIPSIADQCAKDRKGDCGQLSLLTITILRYFGLQARFVGGLQIDGERVYSHDWVEVLSDNLGWVPIDPFCGIVAFRYGNEEARRFYCGNIDPFRMISTQEFFSNFDPPTKYIRLDPFDNQIGEVQSDTRALGYYELFHDTKVVVCRKIQE